MRTFALVLLLTLALPMASAEWRAFHADERNTGFQPGTAYQVYEDKWWSAKLSPATQVESTPVVADGLVVLADWAGNVRVLDAASGSLKWSATQAKIVGTPAVLSNKLFVVDTTGLLQAYQVETGVKLGSVNVGTTLASPTIHEGKIFIGNEAGEMKAYDTETLTQLWKFSVASVADHDGNSTNPCPPTIPVGQIRGAPAVYEGKVIFGSMNHWVYAINEQGEPGQTTLPQWLFKTNDIVVSSPMIDTANHRVVVGSYDEKVYSLPTSPGGEGPQYATDPKTPCSAYAQSAGWTFNVPSSIGQSKVHSSAATDGQRAFFGANNGHVYSVWLNNGSQAWDFETQDVALSSPAVSNGIVVAASDDTNVYWLNASTGEKLASFSAGAAVKANPALDGNRTFIVSFEGDVYMLGPKIPPRPDLVVTSITYAASTVTAIVTNSGTGPAVASVLRLSIDGALAADLPVPALLPGNSSTVTYAVKLTDGTHALKGSADQAGAVAESDENNNDLTMPIAVAPAAVKHKKKGIPAPPVELLLLALALVAVSRRKKQ